MGIEYTNKITATLVDSMGTEQSIVDAARVSLARPYRVQKRWFSLFRKVSDAGAFKAPHNPARLIARLYKEKHGVPFEHCEMVFHFEMPIFVSRQVVKHRLSSINEISGRYVKLSPKFYLPSKRARLGQSGKAMDYNRQVLSPVRAHGGRTLAKAQYRLAWASYSGLKRLGWSNEQARGVLPTSTYTEMRMKANLRSWLNFISLRVDWGEGAVARSHPQDEIAELGLQVAIVLQNKYPNVWKAFVESGYQAV